MDLSFSGRDTRVVAIEEATQVGQARREAVALAGSAGFGEIDGGRVALAATELATNTLKHGGGGFMLLSVVHGRNGLGVELCTIDRGPGFDLAECLTDGYSTGGTQGLGLAAIRRQASLLEAWSDDRGSIVVARIYIESAARDIDLPYGALRVPMRNEQVCGDAWHIGCDDGCLAVTLIDGLGHGVAAAEAAQAGVAVAAQAGTPPPEDMIARIHAGMSGSRGGAAAVARVELGGLDLQYAGIGNIASSLHDGSSARGLASHPGIVGHQCRRVQTFTASFTPASLLIMHSDGLQSRWNLQGYPGLVRRHPALVAAILQRDFDRGRDDTSVVVVRLGVTDEWC